MNATDNLSQGARIMADMNTYDGQQSRLFTDQPCWCGESVHPTYLDCPYCKGSGHLIGGDRDVPCSRCRLDSRKDSL